MTQDPRETLTRLLERHEADGARPLGELMDAMYTDLRSVADRLMRRERAEHTLQPTALVHEAYLRLVDSEKISEAGRLRFLEAAAVTMRRVLVDYARRSKAQKRGGAWERVTLDGMESRDPGGDVDLLALDEALERLKQLDERQAQIVELRFFGGMTGKEIAEHLGLSRNTVVRELTFSRAWLRTELRDDKSSADAENP